LYQQNEERSPLVHSVNIKNKEITMLCNDLPCPPVSDATSPNSGAEVARVTVYGNRFQIYRGDRVFSTIDISANKLEEAASLDQALKAQAHATLFRRSPSTIANPTIQGLSLRAIGPSGAGRALVSLDGVPQSDPFGGWMIWAGLPQTAIQSAHVVRGAGGGAYGAGALTGVVDLRLRSPKKNSFEVESAFSQSGAKRFDLADTLHFGKTDLGLYYSTNTSSGDIPVRGSQRGAADVNTSGRDHSLLANVQTELCITAQCGVLSLVAGDYASRRDTGVKNATAQADGHYASLGYGVQPENGLLGYQIQYWRRHSDLINRSVAIAAGRTSATLSNDQYATPADASGASVAVRGESKRAEWELGIDARQNEGESRELNRYVSQKPTRLRIAGGETQISGGYAQGTLNADAWTFTGSTRIDRWESKAGFRRESDPATGAVQTNLAFTPQSGSITTGRLGAAYAIDATQSVRAAAYNGFRLPTLNELYRPFRVGNDVTGSNAALKAERLTGVELGWRLAQASVEKKSAFIDADIFYNQLRDPITNVTVGAGPATFPIDGFVPAGGVYRQRQNLGQVRAVGVEVQAQYPLSQELQFTASATATHARVSKANANPTLNGKRPAQAPVYVASTGLQYRKAQLTLAADVLFEGGSFEDDLNSLKLAAYQTLGLSARYQFTPRVDVQLQVLNVLDKDIPIARTADGIVNYDNGRRFWLALRYRM
jgi:vitamin B12 transporter